MKPVLDSNIALKTVLPEVDSGRAIRLIADFKQGLHELRWRLVFHRAMRVGLYDCIYVALARTESCRVVTADQRLLNTFPNDTISLQVI